MTTATQAPPVKVGDIFYTSWGYDQTNVDFYMVVGLSASGKTAKLRQVTTTATETEGPHDRVVAGVEFYEPNRGWCANCGARIEIARFQGWNEGKLVHAKTGETDCPADDGRVVRGSGKAKRPAPKIYTKRLKSYDGEPIIGWNSYANAYRWDGEAKYQTGQGYGH